MIGIANKGTWPGSLYSWGSSRILLEASKQTNTFDRGGFYVHVCMAHYDVLCILGVIWLGYILVPVYKNKTFFYSFAWNACFFGISIDIMFNTKNSMLITFCSVIQKKLYSLERFSSSNSESISGEIPCVYAFRYGKLCNRILVRHDKKAPYRVLRK